MAAGGKNRRQEQETKNDGRRRATFGNKSRATERGRTVI